MMINVKVQSECFVTFVSDFAFPKKCVILTQRSTYLAITPSTVNHAANQIIKCQ